MNGLDSPLPGSTIEGDHHFLLPSIVLHHDLLVLGNGRRGMTHLCSLRTSKLAGAQ